MQNYIQITEEKAFEQDVTTMSYDELMETIRFLDSERKRLSRHVHAKVKDDNNMQQEETILRRAA